MMYKGLFDSAHCGRRRNEKRCLHCRNDVALRALIVAEFDDVDEIDFECWWESHSEAPERPVDATVRYVTIIPQNIQDISTVADMETAIDELPGELAQRGRARLSEVLQDKKLGACCGGVKPLAVMRVWLTENK